ncbi:MAG: SDR family oxidoreductase [Anaerolineae bacterium]|nr:SDR family oxidoreductase [Thermoflexales bacterium]MDW8407977.1 SDR family oxidoreductase [Anaerolineae bacterium]
MNLFDLTGRVAVVIGGSGTLGAAMAHGLLDAGACVCILGRDLRKASRVAGSLSPDPARVMAVSADVTVPVLVEQAADAVIRRWGRVDILVNAAGGNRPDATTDAARSFFDLPFDSIRAAIDLNLMGTLLPCQVFGRLMAQAKYGSIITISSMAVPRALTRVVGYSAGKAGMENFTRWLAVYMAREVSPALRVNAIAPGFFLADQNRAMLVDPATGSLTSRGQAIIEHTPMRRFGEPADLIGALLWLASDASAFVTGIVVPVDGGFSAFSGV